MYTSLLLSLSSAPAGAAEPCTAVPIAGDASAAVRVTVRVQTPAGHGTGVFFADGRILTAAHVVRDEESVQVGLASGVQLTGRVLRSDPQLDLAIVEVDGSGFGCAPLATAREPLGAPLLAVGFPTPASPSVSRGIVSGYPDPKLLQTDAALSPGYSGGALFSEAGTVLGITSWKMLGAGVEGVGYAVPADVVAEWLATPDTLLAVDVPRQQPGPLRPEGERLHVSGLQVYDAQDVPLSIREFATRADQRYVVQWLDRSRRAQGRAWVAGLATVPVAWGTGYYGYWALRAPPAAPQFKQAAVGAAVSATTALVLTAVTVSAAKKSRRRDYETFYTPEKLDEVVEQYNHGGAP